MKKITFFLCALLISAMSFAETATLSSISTKDVATVNGVSVSTTFDGVTCTVTKNSGNQPGFYTSSGIVRYYAKDVMTLSVESGYAITKIEFTMTSGTVGTASPEGLSENTWTGNAESVSFTGGGTVKITKIVVTYEANSTSDVIVKTLKSIAVGGMTTTYEQGDIFRFDGTCTATYSVVKNEVAQEDEQKVVTPTSVSTPDMSTAGEKEVTVTYTEGEVTKTATYTITVNLAEGDKLVLETTGVKGTSYVDWKDVKGASGAVYAGNSAGGNNSIQLRSDKNSAGIITTTSGGLIRKVKVDWNINTAAERTLKVYGKNTAYTAASELYGNTAGELLGTIVNGTSKELVINGDYEYVGLVSAEKALYLDKVVFVWEKNEDPDGPTTALENIAVEGKAVKAIINGQLIIIKNGVQYNAQGQVIK